MIAAIAVRLANRFGIAPWLIEVAFVLLAATALIGAGAALHHHVYHQGELAADARNAKVNKANSDRAKAVLADLNQKIAHAQGKLDAARLRVAQLELENENEKVTSAKLQLDLLAGRERVSVLTRQRPTDQGQQSQGAAAGGMDQGVAVETTLDGRVASDLEWARETRNNALKALAACIIEYDAVKTAADAMP